MFFRRLESLIADLHDEVRDLRKDLTAMAISEATFDTDLATLLTAITGYITAAQNALAAAKAQGVDLTTEDGEVTAASAQLATALGAINPTAATAPTGTQASGGPTVADVVAKLS